MLKHTRLLSLSLVALASLSAAACTAPTSTSAAESVDQSSAAVTAPKLNYLAIGDSVPFGFDPTRFSPDPTAPLPLPTAFVGYPDVLSRWVRPLRDDNVACPGETSTSFNLSLTEVIAAVTAAAGDPTHPQVPIDRGCYQAKAKNLLHVPYAISQADEAVAFLKANPRTKLVTVTLGGNDVGAVQDFCQATNTDPALVQQCEGARLPAALATLQSNLATIFTRIRGEAGYQGALLAVTYYSLDYTVPAAADALYAVNQVLSGVATQFGAGIVSGYDAFKAASGPAGSPCKAGLLIPVGQTPTGDTICDVHPTKKGREILAGAVLEKLEGCDD